MMLFDLKLLVSFFFFIPLASLTGTVDPSTKYLDLGCKVICYVKKSKWVIRKLFVKLLFS